MSEFKSSALREYIDKSVMREVAPDFRVRMSARLAKKYDAGEYDLQIKWLAKVIKNINALGIKYPYNAKPVFYLYVVPSDQGGMLRFPQGLTRGGRPVESFDLDGFPRAYGVTEDLLTFKNVSLSLEIGNIHEWAHLVHYMFFTGKDLFIAEGVAEAFPYYLMDYEKIDTAHADMIKNLKESEILNARILAYDFVKHTDYSKRAQINPSYFSSYLFVRGVLGKIEKKYKCSKVDAMQKFMMLVRATDCQKDFLIFEIADFIGMDREELQCGKSLQLAVQRDIAKMKSKPDRAPTIRKSFAKPAGMISADKGKKRTSDQRKGPKTK